MDFLRQYQDIERTLSNQEIVTDVSCVCAERQRHPRKYNCMLVGVEEGQENLTTINHNRRFSKGNIIWVVGEKDSVMKLVKDAG